MIKGIGTDIIKIDRINYRVIKRILSQDEMKYFNSIKNENRKREFAAARFAVKEAIFKAINVSFEFNKISVLKKESGEPFIDEKSMNYLRTKTDNLVLKISISHEKEYAIAFVIAEKEVY